MKKGSAIWMLLAILFAVTTIILGVQYFTGSDTAAAASVNGETIRKSELYTRLQQVGGQQTLDQMITEKLVAQEAKKQGLTVTDAQLNADIDALKQQYGGEVGFAQALSQNNLTLTQLKDLRRTSLAVKAMVEKTITVTDADLQKYFTDNQAQFAEAEQVHAQHILVADEATANKILTDLKGGAKFDDLAKQYSTDTTNKDKGGDLGYFPKGQMDPAFEAAAFGGKAGDLVGPVKSSFGYHIIKVVDHKQATTPTFDQVKDKVTTAYKDAQMQTKQTEFITNLHTNAKIDNKLFPQTAPTTPTAPTTGK